MSLNLLIFFLTFFRDFISDFDMMLEKKREESNKRRKKKKDSEIINDSDDLIVDLISRMKTSAQVRSESDSMQ